MAGVSLKVIVTVLLLAVCGAFVGLVMLGAETATSSVEEVCTDLRYQIAQRVTAQIQDMLAIPHNGLQRMVEIFEARAVNMERWDAVDYHPTEGKMMFHLRQVAKTPGWGSNVYTSNEYGHVLVHYEVYGTPDYPLLSAVSPAADQIVEGVPTWTIPCRYQSNCTHPSNAPNHQYCVNPADPWSWGRYNGEAPFWAEGQGTWKSEEYLAVYPALDPPYATWAAAQNPEGESLSYCRPGAQTAKPHCSDGKGCPEFNFTYYWVSQDVTSVKFRNSFTHFDPRQRWWYTATKELPPSSKYYADVKICQTTGSPCLTATQPLHVRVPAVGAVVNTSDGRTGSVVRYVHTVREMHTPVVRFGGGEVAMSRYDLSLVCTDSGSCGPLGVDAAKQGMLSKFVGVVATDFFATALMDISQSIQVAKTGSLFVGDFSPSALLLTSGFPCAANGGRAGVACFQRTVDGNTEMVSAFDPWAGEVVSGVMSDLFHPRWEDGKWVAVQHREWMMRELDTVASAGGSKYWVRFVPLAPLLENVHNLNWWVCVVIPQDDYLSEIRDKQEVSLGVSLGVAAAVLVLLLTGTVFFIVRPIGRMVDDFDRACTMNLDAIERRMGGAVAELATLQWSFNIMVSNLRLYRTFLPPSVFGMEEEEECMSEESPNSEGKNTAPTVKSPSSMSESERSSSRITGSDRDSGVKCNALGVQLRAGLKTSRVVMVTVGTPGIEVVGPGRPRDLDAKHAVFLSQMLAAAGSRSLAESFCGDQIRFVWNALAPCRDKNVPITAALTMSSLQLCRSKTHIGIATGDAMCGAMGTDTMKKYIVVGPVYHRSAVLMQLVAHYSPKLKRNILLDGLTSPALRTGRFDGDFVDVLHLGSTDMPDPRTWIFTVQCEREQGAEEWIYTYSDCDAVEEWTAFLTGQQKEWSIDLIKQIVSQGMQGKEYVSPTPSLNTVCNY